MFKFIVWVDADSFPKKAREFIMSFTSSKSVPVHLVANHSILSEKSGKILENVSMVVCEKTSGAADDYIFSHTGENDVVVTRDIPFAARLVEKSVAVMNDRGVVFTKDNIEDRLREREFSLNLAQIGLGGGKDNYYGEKELKKFSSVFCEELQKHITIETYNIKRY